MLAVVVSRADSASVHVGEHLHDLADWCERVDSTRADGDGGGTVFRSGWSDGEPGDAAVELREFDDIHLELDGVAEAFGRVDADRADDATGEDEDDATGEGRTPPDLLVFASRHAGETGPLLTAHHTGNFGDADFGGEAGALARACPNAHRRVLDALRERAPPDYEVGTECTHHGPSSVGAPSMFVEVGSGEAQWDDPDAARAVARAVLDLRGVPADAPASDADGRSTGADDADGRTTATENADRRHLVGFGGGHYAPRFERIVRETDWAVGHVAADWGLDDMGDPAANREVVRRAFERSAAARAVVDGEHPDLVETIEDLGYGVASETWVRETSGVPLDLVERLEAALTPVDDGLRFGAPARADDETETVADGASRGRETEFTVVSLPGDLLREAEGIDADATRTAVEAATLAFETTQNGTRAGDRAAVTDDAALESLVEDLATVLERRYDSVDVAADAVIARERAFDPEKARTLGVPEGPAFGKLSSGTPVEVDGRTIPPEEVHEERTARFQY